MRTARAPSARSASSTRGASSPGSTTSAYFASGHTTIEQLQPSMPTGNERRISGTGASSAQPQRDAAHEQGRRRRAIGEDLVGAAHDVDEAPVGHVGRQEPEAD